MYVLPDKITARFRLLGLRFQKTVGFGQGKGRYFRHGRACCTWSVPKTALPQAEVAFRMQRSASQVRIPGKRALPLTDRHCAARQRVRLEVHY